MIEDHSDIADTLESLQINDDSMQKVMSIMEIMQKTIFDKSSFEDMGALIRNFLNRCEEDEFNIEKLKLAHLQYRITFPCILA
jgi:hypothetical protein